MTWAFFSKIDPLIQIFIFALLDFWLNNKPTKIKFTEGAWESNNYQSKKFKFWILHKLV